MHKVLTAWPAPAKINLFLHVTGRRADGYHLLQTAFQFLDLCDELDFESRADGIICRRSELPGVPADEDICVKAARLLQETAGVSAGVDMRIRKRIPMGGGLGGGSSNAATTLWALNRLWSAGLNVEQLASLGLQLGADVPVFVRGHAAWAEGVGEILEPVELPEPWYLLIAPPVHVSTAAVFSAPDLTRNCPPLKIRDLLAGAGENVCEPVVRALFPDVARALDWLAQYAPSRMTGTGACVFGRFDTKAAAEEVLKQFHDEMPAPWRAFVTGGLNRSPLLGFIQPGEQDHPGHLN
ncbi:MAG TPA: 4-(cytidine 5'-diphospho)-2-C-methyl-D-erythritol kinase [Gammaproteobacteria bacterium]